jgi:hypothetical protein
MREARWFLLASPRSRGYTNSQRFINGGAPMPRAFVALIVAIGFSFQALAAQDLPPEFVAVIPSSREKGQDWRYTLTRPAAHWFKSDFNDLSWKTGQGGFGNKGTPNGVDRTPWLTSEIWLRREIILPDGPFTDLQLQVHADDYADIYLNGVLAGKVNKCTPNYVEIPISADARKTLRPGSNVLAATCRDTGGGRYIDVGLVAPRTGGGDKKNAEKLKVLVFEDELENADLKDTVMPESFRKTYTVKLEKNRLYQIILTSKAFAPHVRLENNAREQIDGAAIGKAGSAMIHPRPAKTEDYEIIVTSQNSGAMGKFTLLVKEVPGGNGEPVEVANENGKGTYDGRLLNTDPIYKGGKKHKMLLFKMEAGKTYQIEMSSKAFDSYLFLESPAGKHITEDDDGGGFPTARIVHKAAETGQFRIACTYFAPATGDFRVTIRQLD